MLIEGVALFQSFGYYGGAGRILQTWQQYGVFEYVLPFLILFAIIFGVLSRINIFGGNKAINAIISLAVGLMAIQFNTVTVFFSSIFPRVGIGLAVMLAFIIIVGIFIPESKMSKFTTWLFAILAVGIAIIVVSQSLDVFNTSFIYWFRYNWEGLIGALVFIGFLIAIIFAGAGNPKRKVKKVNSPIHIDATSNSE